MSEHPIRPLAELKSQLGLEMACTLLWIQTQTQPSFGVVINGPTLRMLGCGHCSQAAIFTIDRKCQACGRRVAVDDSKALYFGGGVGTAGMVTQVPDTEPATSNLLVNLQYLLCRNCKRAALPLTNYTCPTCSRPTAYQNVKLIPAKRAVESGSTSQKILEEFGDELARYESWDQ